MRKATFLALFLCFLSLPVCGSLQTADDVFVPSGASAYRAHFIAEMRTKGYEISDFEQVEIRGENKGNLIRYEAILDGAYSIKLSQMAGQEDQIISCYAGWAPSDSVDIPTAISEMKEIWKCLLVAASPSTSEEEVSTFLDGMLESAARTALSNETEYSGIDWMARGQQVELLVYNGFVSLTYVDMGNLSDL